MKWMGMKSDELETIINIDYEGNKVGVYTNKKSVADRIMKKGYKPTRVYNMGAEVCAVDFVLNKSDMGDILKVGIFGYGSKGED